MPRTRKIDVYRHLLVWFSVNRNLVAIEIYKPVLANSEVSIESHLCGAVSGDGVHNLDEQVDICRGRVTIRVPTPLASDHGEVGAAALYDCSDG